MSCGPRETTIRARQAGKLRMFGNHWSEPVQAAKTVKEQNEFASNLPFANMLQV